MNTTPTPLPAAAAAMTQDEAAARVECVRNALASHGKGLDDDWQDFIAEQICDLNAALRALTAPAGVPDGFVLVPAKASDAMCESVDTIVSTYAAAKIWERMTLAGLLEAPPSDAPGEADECDACGGSGLKTIYETYPAVPEIFAYTPTPRFDTDQRLTDPSPAEQASTDSAPIGSKLVGSSAEQGAREDSLFPPLNYHGDCFLYSAVDGGIVVDCGFGPDDKACRDRAERIHELLTAPPLAAGRVGVAEGSWSVCGRCLQHDDFSIDARLELSGDFATREERDAFLVTVRNKLNAPSLAGPLVAGEVAWPKVYGEPGDNGRSEPMTPEDCAEWLDAKWERHNELEDRACAEMIRALAALVRPLVYADTAKAGES